MVVWDSLNMKTPLGKSRNKPCHCGSGAKLKKCCRSPKRVNEYNAEQKRLDNIRIKELRNKRAARKGSGNAVTLMGLMVGVGGRF
jgi:hypothetical protein